MFKYKVFKMSFKPLLTHEEITERYLDEWYLFQQDENGNRRSEQEIEQKRIELCSLAAKQIDAQEKKKRFCVLL